MFRIGEFSKLVKTTVKTLRFYDEIDLFKPLYVDDNGYRYYSIEQLSILQRIVELRKFDMPIDDIKKILNGDDIIKVLKSRKNELENELEQNLENLTLIKKLMALAQKGDFMNKYQAKEIMMPKCIVYYRRGVIPNMSFINEFVVETGEEVKINNPTLKCSKLKYCFITYTAKEYKEKNVELEFAEAVDNFGKESKNIKFKELPEEKAISVFHKGAYDKIGEAYAYVVNWVKENGYKINNPIRERYISGCWNKTNEEDYLTEIQVPVK